MTGVSIGSLFLVNYSPPIRLFQFRQIDVCALYYNFHHHVGDRELQPGLAAAARAASLLGLT